jgi:hypothetical protein
MMRTRRLSVFVALIFGPLICPSIETPLVPEPVSPIFSKLKDMHLDTPLVWEGRPRISIVIPASGLYRQPGEAIRAAIRRITGVRIPVIMDTDAEAAVPVLGNLILLGNRSTNRAVCSLYDRAYTFLDLRYPGPGGYEVRTLHSPFGDGRNVIFVGGSDAEGVQAAAQILVKRLDSAGGGCGRLVAGRIMDIGLGRGVSLPREAMEAEVWEASRMYGSSGYFGWNMLSKLMALYYMTGDKSWIREFIRLAFPDTRAIRELEDRDGERIEDKRAPLSGPYHYSAHMMILLWDLIEESDLFTDEERLRITNAFSRQLEHRSGEGVYGATVSPPYVGDRHGDWAAVSLYCLGRYFQKDYPAPVWRRCLTAAGQYFSALRPHCWFAGMNDHLFWYSSFYDPVLDYILLSGDRTVVENGNLGKVLTTQEIVSTGLNEDWGVNASSLSFFNKAAYLTGDGRWLWYRERTRLKTDPFRLGQSFWPGENLPPYPPSDRVGRWTIQQMPEPMWQARNSGISLANSFLWGSYRSSIGGGGDYVLLKGFNGGGRLPYHNCAVTELRLRGTTLLKGYRNQVYSSFDGMVEPEVAMDGALLYHDVVGETAAAVMEIPKLSFCDWRRTLAQCVGHYTLIVDDVAFRVGCANVQLVTRWETPDTIQKEVGTGPFRGVVKLTARSGNVSDSDPGENFELRSSESAEVRGGDAIDMQWRGGVQKGEHRFFFYLLAPNGSGGTDALACLRLSENAAIMKLPETALAVSGEYQGLAGELVLLSDKRLYGHAMAKAGLNAELLEASRPIDVDWGFAGGVLCIVTDQPVQVRLNLNSEENLTLDRHPVRKSKPGNGSRNFLLNPGRHIFQGAFPFGEKLREIDRTLSEFLARGSRLRSAAQSSRILHDRPIVSELAVAFSTPACGRPLATCVIPLPSDPLICLAEGKTIHLFDATGRRLRLFCADEEIRTLHWWNEPRLLLAGCRDEKVIAFDITGKRRWVFVSQMDPAVAETGKQYWFKAAHPGIHGLGSGVFLDGKSQCFVGSACGVEMVDEKGRLVKRLPVFWGPARSFLLVDGADGDRNLLIARWHNDSAKMAVVNNGTLKVGGPDYYEVPSGHTLVGGWDSQNREDNFFVDLEGDGEKEVISAINGSWNRVGVWKADGTPLANAQFGPGDAEPRANMRATDVADINGDGRQEIVAAISGGMVVALDTRCRKLWAYSLPSPPRVMRLVPSASAVAVGCDDGSVITLNGRGEVTRRNRLSGRPEALEILETPSGPMAVLATDSGQITAFRLRR